MTKKKAQALPPKQGKIIERTARAPAHKELANNNVHVFVDDQNLFWGSSIRPAAKASDLISACSRSPHAKTRQAIPGSSQVLMWQA
ncbi:hypothetical protein GCM10011321_14740 [Youhaiella tibetensis]|nr:hypothetical protein GCM10011321_14740 [Youhaiella tibetensis]